MENVASRYGLALYSLALEENKIDSWQQDVKTLKGVDKNIVALIDVIMENNRTDCLIDVFDSFNSYCNQYRGVSEGLIYSTLKLDQTVIDQIEKKISKIEGSKVELKNVVDPSLIGGVKIVIKDHIYDGSIKHNIEMMKKDLLK